jgi:hypothetical protein
MSVVMNEPARRRDEPDPTFYPEEEKVGERLSNRLIADELRRLVERWLAERGVRALVGADQFIYWEQHKPTRTLAPDVYVLPDVDPQAEVRVWKVWETGIVPSWAVEIVGRDVRKDYQENPPLYDELGVRELVIFDADYQESAERARFVVWRRRRGKLEQVERTDRDRVRSIVLGCFIRDVGEGTARRLRLATGRTGDALVPTAEESLARAEAELEALRRRER